MPAVCAGGACRPLLVALAAHLVLLGGSISHGGSHVLKRDEATNAGAPRTVNGITPVLFHHNVEGLAMSQLTPLQFLIISSPFEKKITWTRLRNFKSVEGRAFPLIDSGLSEPRGIALDRERGRLYVADRQMRKIFHYRVYVQKGGDGYADDSVNLVTDGVQLTIQQDREVEYVAVDTNGDLFFSEYGKKAIIKVPFNLISVMGAGKYQAGQIVTVRERQLEAMSSAEVQRSLSLSAGNIAVVPIEAQAHQLTAFSLYEINNSPYVGKPGGLVSDGRRLYWTNTRNGSIYGTVGGGEVNPGVDRRAAMGGSTPNFPTRMIANITEHGYGIAKSNNLIFITASTGEETITAVAGRAGVSEGSVYAVTEQGVFTKLASGLVEPRGIVWDGDGTIYVADQAADTVYSMPVGRLVSNAPRSKVVDLRSAFGLALLSADDPAFQIKPIESSGTIAVGPFRLPLAVLALVAWLAAVPNAVA